MVDNNSTDSTQSVLQKYSALLDLVVLGEKIQGLSAARNRGITAAKTEYITFLDDDAVAEKNWLEAAVKIIKTGRNAIFGGPIYPFYRTARPIWFKDKYESLAYDEDGVLAERSYLWSSNMFVRREVFDSVGLMDKALGMNGKTLGTGEETKLQEQARRYGYKIYYYQDLVVHHLIPAHKMDLRYMTRRFLLSEAQKYRIIGNYGFFDALADCLKELSVMAVLAILYPFRNRKKYPNWRNYYVERYLHRFGRLRWVSSYFKDLFYGKKR